MTFGLLLIIMSIVLIVGGIYIFFSKGIKYSAGINRDFFFRGIAGFFGAKEAQYEMKGIVKNMLAVALIFCGLFILISTFVNIKYIL